VKPPKKNAPADESGIQKQRRRKEQLIRLDDLIPKKDVTGGSRSLFGVSNTKQTAPNKKKK
jgi:hypothetical protein